MHRRATTLLSREAGSPAPHRATRPHAIALDFGGIVVRVESHKPEWLEQVAARFGAYRSRARPTFDLQFVPRARLEEESRRPRGGDSPPIRLTAASYVAVADLPRRRAWLAGRPRPGTLLHVMRYLLPLLVPGGIAFHAAVLAEGSRGFLMAGPSGAGKSSLARLFRSRALGDEVGVVVEGESGFRIHGSPHRLGRAGKAELQGIYLLARGRGERLRLHPVAALERLAALAFWPTGEDPAMRRTLAGLVRLAESVPVWELRFRLRPEVWKLISAPPEEA